MTEAMRHFNQVMLASAARDAVEGDELDYKRYRHRILHVTEQLPKCATPSEIRNLARQADEASLEYSEQLREYLRARAQELRSLVPILTQALIELQEGGKDAAQELGRVERRLTQAAQIEDIREIKNQLVQAIEQLRAERRRQQSRVNETVEQIRSGISPQMLSRYRCRAIDPVQLPSRGEAESVVDKLFSEPRQNRYAAVLVVNRIAIINARYGHAVGDQAIQAFVRYLLDHLQPDDMLFRWSGPAFLAILEREAGLADVAKEAARVGGAQLEREFELQDRSVLIPISSVFQSFPLSEEKSAEAAVRRIAQFVQKNTATQ
jgi:GGDEF domain-containing protein